MLLESFRVMGSSQELYLTLLARVAFPDSLSQCPIPFLDTEAGLCVYEASPVIPSDTRISLSVGEPRIPGIANSTLDFECSYKWQVQTAQQDCVKAHMIAPGRYPCWGPLATCPIGCTPGATRRRWSPAV